MNQLPTIGILETTVQAANAVLEELHNNPLTGESEQLQAIHMGLYLLVRNAFRNGNVVILTDCAFFKECAYQTLGALSAALSEAYAVGHDTKPIVEAYDITSQAYNLFSLFQGLMN